SIYIPFLTTVDFNFIVGIDTYSFSDIIPADITLDRIVDLSFANYFVPANGQPAGALPISFPFTADPTTNLLTMATTAAYPTNTPITLSTTGTLPSPFISGTTYWVINVSPTTLYLAATSADAVIGNFMNIISTGTGSNIITAFNFPVGPVNASLVYPLKIINKATYWNVVRQSNLLSRPGFIFLNKQAEESFITVYPVPDQPYPVKLQVKCMINNLENMDTLAQLPPNSYGFLKLAMAKRFNWYYPSSRWTPDMQSEYDDYYETFKATNETDLTIRPSVILTAPEPFYWPNILSY
ncbi:MAG TPA: hypothetical protein VK590_04235, partial [Saprospiraceae bacterium]|nr:hypothetical protein [Saprospiraceae bacterium]